MKTPFWGTTYWAKNWGQHNCYRNSLIASKFLLCSWNFVVFITMFFFYVCFTFYHFWLFCYLSDVPSSLFLLSLVLPPISWYVVFVSPSLSFAWSPLSVSLFLYFSISPLWMYLFSSHLFPLYLSLSFHVSVFLLLYFWLSWSQSPGLFLFTSISSYESQ